jgi:hypothetical protein
MDFYQSTNLDDTQLEFVKGLEGKLNNAVNNFATKVQALQGSIGGLSEIVQDYVNCSLERADIIKKYYYDDQYQNHLPLPGMVTAPRSYDISQVKADNERVEQVQDLMEKAEDQKNISTNLLQSDFEDVVTSYKNLIGIMQGLGEAIAEINSSVEA